MSGELKTGEPVYEKKYFKDALSNNNFYCFRLVVGQKIRKFFA